MLFFHEYIIVATVAQQAMLEGCWIGWTWPVAETSTAPAGGAPSFPAL